MSRFDFYLKGLFIFACGMIGILIDNTYKIVLYVGIFSLGYWTGDIIDFIKGRSKK